MKVSIASIGRAFAWIILGIFFGFALIWLILMSPVLFVQHNTQINVFSVLHEEFVAFLGVALIGSAFSDYVLSVNFKGYKKLIIFLLVVIGCITVFYIFNPAVDVRENVKRNFTKIFCVGALVFCLCLKSVIFYQEEFAHKKLKNRL